MEEQTKLLLQSAAVQLSMMSSPPFYILFSHSSISNTSTVLGHPAIQYHYADDSPLALLPEADEHVLLLDYNSESLPIVKTLSKDIAVTGLKLEDAPGAAVADECEVKRNDKMHIIETVAVVSEDRYVFAFHGLFRLSRDKTD